MGYKGYGQWGTGVWGLWAMGHREYGPHRQWVTWAMGYKAMGHMSNEAHWGYRVQGYGAHGVWGTRGVGHVGNGIHGQWGTGVWGKGAHGRFAPKISKRCQVVKKMSSCQKDVKCQKMKHLGYGGGSQKIKLTQWGSHILMSILMSQMMVTKNT